MKWQYQGRSRPNGHAGSDLRKNSSGVAPGCKKLIELWREDEQWELEVPFEMDMETSETHAHAG